MNSSQNSEMPKHFGYSMRAEWERQESLWLAWPAKQDLWTEQLPGAQKAVLETAKAAHDGGLRVEFVVETPEDIEVVKTQLQAFKVDAHFHPIPFGDIWLRDIGPIFVSKDSGHLATVCFQFNGWGGKYNLAGDQAVAMEIAKTRGFPIFEAPFILEGGAIEVDGEGNALTTEQCLLNANRNKNLDRKANEKLLSDYLGIENVIWLGKGLHHDHTDGHIDNIARFVSPGVIVCMESLLKNDPQRDILADILKRLKKAKDAHGKKFEIFTVPSPGLIKGAEGDTMPASYLNFVILNDVVAFPSFKANMDEQVYYRLENLFPSKKILAIDCRDLLSGGGTLHCMSKNQPQA